MAVKGARKRKYDAVVRREIDLLKSLKHENIIAHLGALLTADNEMLHLVEFMDGGDLCQLITETQGLDELQTRSIFTDVCAALNYLHSRGMVHSDVKPENVLLAGDGTAKLCDFEMCTPTGKVPNYSRGTRAYAPPELVTNRGILAADPAQDVFSLGVLLFVMLNACFPWVVAQRDDPKYAQYLQRQHLGSWPWQYLAPSLRQLLDRCLHDAPDVRCSVEAAAKMASCRKPWFIYPL